MKPRRCNKVGYRTLADAETALLKCRINKELKHRQGRQEQRAYVCRVCSAWHLTSQPAVNRGDQERAAG